MLQSTESQRVRHVSPFVTPWTPSTLGCPVHHQLLELAQTMSIESVMPSNFAILLQSFLASGFFPVSQFFTSGGQSIEVSASVSVLPMNIQD